MDFGFKDSQICLDLKVDLRTDGKCKIALLFRKNSAIGSGSDKVPHSLVNSALKERCACIGGPNLVRGDPQKF